MRPLTHCTESWFPMVTSGIRYMCVEQKNAFDVLLDCADMNSLTIKHGFYRHFPDPFSILECDLQCNPNSLVTGLAVKDTVMQSLDQPLGNGAVNVKHLIEPHLGRIAFSESCRFLLFLVVLTLFCFQNHSMSPELLHKQVQYDVRRYNWIFDHGGTLPSTVLRE